MHSIKLLLFSLALVCCQTATSHALHTNLEAVSDDNSVLSRTNIVQQEDKINKWGDEPPIQILAVSFAQKGHLILPSKTTITPPQISKYC